MHKKEEPQRALQNKACRSARMGEYEWGTVSVWCASRRSPPSTVHACTPFVVVLNMLLLLPLLQHSVLRPLVIDSAVAPSPQISSSGPLPSRIWCATFERGIQPRYTLRYGKRCLVNESESIASRVYNLSENGEGRKGEIINYIYDYTSTIHFSRLQIIYYQKCR